jgi:hypothetical protein
MTTTNATHDMENGQHRNLNSNMFDDTRTHVPTLASASHSTRIASPGPLGLWAFATTTFIFSAYNAQIQHITSTNLVVGMALSCGGLAQFMAGMWQFPRGNTFAATAFTLYGAFWISYAVLLIPSSGVTSAYGNDAEMFADAFGFFYTAWFLVTMMLFIATFRKNIGMTALFGFWMITYLLLLIGAFRRATNVTRAAGAIGIVTACIAYYLGLVHLIQDEMRPLFPLPVGIYGSKNGTNTSKVDHRGTGR